MAPRQDRYEVYERFLAERFGEFRRAIYDLFYSFADVSKDARKAQVTIVKNAISGLVSALPREDQPQWLQGLNQHLAQYTANQASKQADKSLLSGLLTFIPLMPERWMFADSDSRGIDFAGIYTKHYNESTLPKLFEQLVTQLEEIAKSGLVDSLACLQSLERLIATIRKNARADYISTRGAADFARRWILNVFVQTLEEVPGLSIFVKATRETVKEIDAEMGKVEASTKKEFKELADVELPALEYQPNEAIAKE